MLWSRLGCRRCAPDKRAAYSCRVHEAAEPVGVGAQSSLARRLSHDCRGGGRRPVVYPPWPRRRTRVSSSRRWWSKLCGRARPPRKPLNQITERLERTLEETPHLDFLRSFTTPGATTIFVNLKGSTSAQQVADTWYHVRKSIADMRHTLPSGVRGPFFNDEFGDTFGIIYGFTADGFTPRELRDYVEDARSQLLSVPDVSKIEILGAQDEQIFIDFSVQELASLGIDRGALIAALQAQNIVRPAGVIQTGNESVSMRVSGAFSS